MTGAGGGGFPHRRRGVPRPTVFGITVFAPPGPVRVRPLPLEAGSSTCRPGTALLGPVSILVVAAYFLLPFSSAFTSTTVVLLVAGLVGLGVLLAWHLRSIIRSPYPRVRAVAALATLVPMFLVLFATAYFVMSRTLPGQLLGAAVRLDSAYYTVTVFSTVGFGDITPVTQSARAATMGQMVGDVVLVGLVAQVIVGAVRQGVRRREAQEPGHDER